MKGRSARLIAYSAAHFFVDFACALRLLGSEARMRMLWAMLDRPMSARELSQQLELHLGGVCRDISSLFHSRLITTEQVNGRNRYRTNQESLCILAKHLTQMEEFRLP